MGETSSSAVKTILATIPFVIAIGLYATYLYGRALRSRTLEEMNWLRAELRRISIESQRVRGKAGTFSSDDPEPFGPLVTELTSAIYRLDLSIRKDYHRYSTLHLESNDLATQGLWFLPRSLTRWYRLRGKVGDFYINLEETQSQLSRIQELNLKIEQMGWEVACQSKLLLEKLQSSFQNLRLLQEEIGGEEYEKAVHLAQQWQKTLTTQIPVVFLIDDQQALVDQVDKGSITQVYRVVEAAKPEIDNLAKTTDEWKNQYDGLFMSLKSIQECYHKILASFQILENQDQYPVRFDQSRISLEDLNTQAGSLLPEGRVSTPNQISRGLKRAKKLQNQLQILNETSQRVRTQYEELVLYITKPELQQGGDWIRAAFDLLVQVKKFDPVNWPPADQVDSFEDDLKKIEDYQGRIPVFDTGSTISETEVPEMSASAKQLFALHQTLRSRLSDIQKRLVEIQTTERTAKEPISRAHALLQQIAALSSSNSMLKKVIGQDNARLIENLEQIMSELDHPEQGVVEKKAQKASALLRKVEQGARKWLDALDKDLSERTRILVSKVDKLREIVILDDPTLVEIQDLVVKDERLVGPQSRTSKRTDVPLMQVVNEIKIKNEIWQRCISLSYRVGEVAGPVLERYQKAEKNRNNALDKIGKANQVIPEELGWPPTTQRLSNERLLMGTLEKRWLRLKQERQKTLQLVSELSELAEQYHEVATRAGQSIQTAEQEQSRIRDYERRLEESKRLWIHQIEEHKDKAKVASGIEEMLTEVDREVEALRSKYQRGLLQYNQVLQTMRSVCRRIDETLLPVDASLVIDINGVIQKRVY